MEADTLQMLRALNERFIINFVTRDTAAHDAIIHPDFICILADGRRLERGPYLEFWATAFDPEVFQYWDYRDESIGLFGDVALVRSTTKFVRLEDGNERAGMSTYTDTYLQENGRWLCIQAQLTPVDPAHYPGDETIVRAWTNGQPQAG